jgi:hypothetical protein
MKSKCRDGPAMTDTEWRYLARKRSRLEQQGTLNPFCCVCGEHDWRVRYDLHHFARRKFDPTVIRLCIICHNRVSDMEKEFPPIPVSTEPRLAKAIAVTRGRIFIFRLALAFDEEHEAWLSGTPFLPALPEPNGGDDDA